MQRADGHVEAACAEPGVEEVTAKRIDLLGYPEPLQPAVNQARCKAGKLQRCGSVRVDIRSHCFLRVQVHMRTRSLVYHNGTMGASPTSDKGPVTLDVTREFQRRMAAIVDAVQTGVWEAGVHDLLGHATDYAFGQQRGLQTLVLKTTNRSAYVRLTWDTVMGTSDGDRQLVDAAIKSAIRELS